MFPASRPDRCRPQSRSPFAWRELPRVVGRIADHLPGDGLRTGDGRAPVLLEIQRSVFVVLYRAASRTVAIRRTLRARSRLRFSLLSLCSWNQTKNDEG